MPKGGHLLTPRRSAEKLIEKTFNSFAAKSRAGYLGIESLKRIAKTDPDFTRRAAAVQCLQACEYPDIADYEAALVGDKSLNQLRELGLNTSAIKKFKIKIKNTTNANGDITTERTADMELHQRAGESLDRIMDRTGGRPRVSVDLAAQAGPPEIPSVDLSALSPAELETMLALVEKANAPRPDPDAPRPANAVVTTPAPNAPPPTRIVEPGETLIDSPEAAGSRAETRPAGDSLALRLQQQRLLKMPLPVPAGNPREERLASKLLRKYGHQI